ncbi:MAG: hypothetical protein ACYC1I_11710 [Acidimicrobiales bacterium]
MNKFSPRFNNGDLTPSRINRRGDNATPESFTSAMASEPSSTITQRPALPKITPARRKRWIATIDRYLAIRATYTTDETGRLTWPENLPYMIVGDAEYEAADAIRCLFGSNEGVATIIHGGNVLAVISAGDVPNIAEAHYSKDPQDQDCRAAILVMPLSGMKDA